MGQIGDVCEFDQCRFWRTRQDLGRILFLTKFGKIVLRVRQVFCQDLAKIQTSIPWQDPAEILTSVFLPRYSDEYFLGKILSRILTKSCQDLGKYFLDKILPGSCQNLGELFSWQISGWQDLSRLLGIDFLSQRSLPNHAKILARFFQTIPDILPR